MEKCPPRLIHIGTQRAGSTFLYHCLRSHPQTSMSSPQQEVDFYTKYYDKGLGWYLSAFPQNGVPIDVSPGYFRTGRLAAHRIMRELGNSTPRFSLILRNPIDYIESLYNLEVRRGIISSGPLSPPRPLAERLDGYIGAALYATLLKKWYKVFGAEQFKILVFERFVAEPLKSAESVATFFGLEHGGLQEPDTLASNPTPQRYHLDNSIRNLARATGLARIGRQYSPIRTLHATLVGRGGVVLDAAGRQTAAEMLKDEVEELRRLLDDPLVEWEEF